MIKESDPSEAFLVWDHDDTSLSGRPKLLGVAFTRATAEEHAARVHQRDSWHSGGVSKVEVLEAGQ